MEVLTLGNNRVIVDERVIVGSADGSLRLFDLNRAEAPLCIARAAARLTAAAIAPNGGAFIALTTADGSFQ